jgi:hypothetical protein
MKKNYVRTLTGIALGSLLMVGIVANADEGVAPQSAPHPKVSRIEKRIKKQEKRIEQGVNSGKLTPEQASQLRNDETNIQNKVNSERAANGGKLTKAQKQEINQELNAESQKIKAEKHPVPSVPPVQPQ